MDDENNYGSSQNPDDDYADSQNPVTLYADNSSQAKKSPPRLAGSGATSAKPSSAQPIIHVTVNPASRIKAVQFVDIINKTPGLATELKDKIRYDKKSNSIIFPDFSKDKVIPGKEWLFDLGKAGNDWEFTTATLVLVIGAQTYFKFIPHLQAGEERGFAVGKDPDESLMSPSSDLKDINKGLIVGLTIPNQTILNKNPPPENTFPPPQIARLKSGRGLILIANNLIVEKRSNQTNKDAASLPKSMIAMSCLHELAAHAGFFELGQDAAHSDPFDPVNNAVDRNSQQLAIIYKSSIDKEQPAFEKKVKFLVDGMNKAVP